MNCQKCLDNNCTQQGKDIKPEVCEGQDTYYLCNYSLKTDNFDTPMRNLKFKTLPEAYDWAKKNYVNTCLIVECKHIDTTNNQQG
jgi:hypothetical protein